MIEQLLKEVGEDKCDNLSTTSLKFKRDLWKFFLELPYGGPSWRADNKVPFKGFIGDKVAVEFGTHKGQTTRILAHLFDKVYTINQNDNVAAKEFNKDLNNIVYIDHFDLYSGEALYGIVKEPVFAVLIDAGHTCKQVIEDVNRCFSDLNLEETCYLIFDDYGLEQYKEEVKAAVNQGIEVGAFKIAARIGHEAGHNFGGDPPRVLSDSEGVICKVQFQEI